MGVPVLWLWKCLVDAVVKVLVVGEDDMATDIVEKTFWCDISRGQTTRSLVGVDNQP